MNEKQKKGKSARDKGARYELELVHILRDFYGYPVRRGYVFQHESDVIGLQGVHIECKAVERLNIRKAYKQAVEEALERADGVPVVFHHKNREGWLVTMSLEDFMDFYGGWHDTERDGASAHEGDGFDQ
jgi:Holliday junction resolvase